MAEKYKGPERRKKDQGELGRRWAQVERRREDRVVGKTTTETRGMILGSREYTDRRMLSKDLSIESAADMPSQDILSVHEHKPRPERRTGGAGRRKSDLASAIKWDKPVIFQMGKGVMKSAGKLAKKAAKHIPAIGVAAGIYDLVNRAKK